MYNLIYFILTIIPAAFLPSMNPLGMTVGVRISSHWWNSWKRVWLGKPRRQIVIPSSKPLQQSWFRTSGAIYNFPPVETIHTVIHTSTLHNTHKYVDYVQVYIHVQYTPVHVYCTLSMQYKNIICTCTVYLVCILYRYCYHYSIQCTLYISQGVTTM